MNVSRIIYITHRLEASALTLAATFIAAFLFALPALLVTGCTPSAKSDSKDTTMSATNDANDAASQSETPSAARGEYMVTIGGCDDCHTPWKMGEKGPEPDMSRRLSGHPESIVLDELPKATKGWGMIGSETNTAWFGGWGTSYTMNLTPDSLTGIGTWTEEIFVNTIRSGKHWGTSRPIMPPMPWFNYAKMTDVDLKSVYAFLRTIPPIENRVPDYRPPAGPPTAAK